MANKFSQTIEFKGEFDISGILQSYKKLSSQMAKQGASPQLLGDIDTEIEKVEKAARQMQNQINKGFSSSREFKNFDTQVDNLYKGLENIQDAFKSLNKNSDNFAPAGLDDALKDLKQYRKQIADLQKAQKTSLSRGLKGVGYSADSAKDTADRIKSEEELIQALTREYEIRQRLKQTAMKEYQKARKQSDKDIGNANLPANATNLKTTGLRELGMTQEDIREVADNINSTFMSVFKNASGSFTKVWEKVYAQNEAFINDLDDGGEQLRQNIHEAVQLRDAARQQLARQHNVKGTQDAQDQLGSGAVDDIQWSDRTNAIIEEYNRQLREIQQNEVDVAAAERVRDQATNDVNNAIEENNRELRQQASNLEQNEQAMTEMTDETRDAAEAQQQLDSSFDELKDRAKQFLSIGAAITGVKEVIGRTYDDVKELDEAFASIALVTSESVEGMWDYYGQYAEIANELGQSTKDVISSSALYIQQGLEMNEALDLSTETMKMARLAQIDYSDATSFMTSAIRGFHMEMTEGNRIMDVYSELAANAAADVKGIAEAMSRTASIANSAGMEFETTSALLTQMIETTQESPENLGTAMKSIIARFTELKENVAGTEESEFEDLDFNNVDKALKSVGVQLKDSTGQFRDLDDVFLELSQRWDTLDRNSQRYIATIAAGSRQQSRFIAMMENYDRTVELVSTAYDSAGRGEEQFAKSQDTLQAKLNTLANTWEQFRLKFFDQTFFKDIIDLANELLGKISKFDMKQVLTLGVIGITLGKTIVTNFISQLKAGAPKIQEAWQKVMTTSLKDRFSKEAAQERKDNWAHAIGKVTETDKKQFVVQQAGLTLGPKNAGFPTMGLDAEVQKTQQLQQQLRIYAQIQQEEKMVAQNLTRVNSLDTQRVAELRHQLELRQREGQAALADINNLSRELGYEKQITAENAKQIQQGLANTQNAPTGGFKGSQAAAALGTAASSALTAGLTTAITTAVAGGDLTAVITSAGSMALTAAIPSIIGFVIPHLLAILAGPAGLVVLAAGIIAAIIVALDNIDKKNEEVKQAELERLGATEKTNRELQEQQEQLLKKYKSKQSEIDSYDADVKKYQYLQSKAVLTTAEEEEKATLADDLTEKYPDIIFSYDENTHEIEFNTIAMEELRKTLEEEKHTLEEQMILNNATQTFNLNTSLNRSKEIIDDFANDNNYGYKNDVGSLYLDEESALEDYVADNRDILKSIDQKYLEEQGITSDIYKKALKNDNGKDFISALQEAGIALSSFRERVVAASEAQAESWEEQLKNKNADLIRTQLMAEGIEEGVADLISNIDITASGESLQDTLNEKINKGMETYFSRINDETFSGGRLDFNKDFLDDLRKGVFSRIAGEGYNTDQFADVFSAFGYTQDGVGDSKSMAELFEKDTTNMVMFDQLSAEMQAAAEAANITQKQWDADRKDASKMVENMKKIMTYGFIAQEGLLPEGITTEDIQSFTPQIHKVQEAIADSANKTIEEYEDSIDAGLSEIDTTTEAGKQIRQATREKKEEALEQWQQDLTDIYNWGTGGDKADYSEVVNDTGNEIIKNFVTNLSQTSANTLNQLLKNLDATGLQKQQWLNLMAGQFSEYGTEITDILLSVDVSQSFNELMKSEQEYVDMIAAITHDRKQAEEIYTNYVKTATSVLSRAIIGDVGVEGVKNSINESFSTFDEQFEKIFSAQEEFYEKGKISSSTYFDMLEAGFGDFVDITEDGYVLLADKAEEYYVSAGSNARNQLKQAIETNERILANVDKVYESDKDLFTAAAIKEAKEQGDKFDYKGKGYDAEQRSLMETLVNSQYDSVQEYRNALTGTNNRLHSMDSDAYIQDLVFLEEHYIDLREQTKEQEEELQELQDDLSKLQDELADLQDELNDLNDELIENQEAIDDAYKAWQESIHGTDDYQSSIDGLINYNNLLEATEHNLSDIKEGMEDIQSVDEGFNTIQQLKNITEQQLGQFGAEKQVIDNAMENVYQTLLSNYGNYTQFDQNGRLAFDFSIEDADMPDTMKDNYQTLIEQYNDFVSQKEDVTDKEKDANQVFLDMQEQFVDSRVAMEEKVIDLLKEQMQKEVDEVNEKYEAIEEADNNYLDALEEAIKKQRELREQENKYEDLAQKQKKLSLMQRDTSGANQKEVQKLQEEVQNDRQDLLNDEIDNVIDSLKELYEKQAEARELEIEAMEVTIEDMSLLNQMAQNVIAGFQNSDDIVGWFLSNNPEVNDMTVAQTEQYINEIKDESSGFLMSIAAQTGDVTLDAERVAEITQATFEEVAQGITDVGTVTQEQAEKTAQEAIDNAKEAYDSAVQAMNDTQAKIEETKNKIAETNNEIIKTHDDILLKEQEVQKARDAQSESFIYTMSEMQTACTSAMEDVAYRATQFMIEYVADEGDLNSPTKVADFARNHNMTDGNDKISLGTYNAFADAGYATEELEKMIRTKTQYTVNFSPPSSGIDITRGPFSTEEEANDDLERLKKMNRGGSGRVIPETVQYKTGGLVDYTGPAWVDGTPSKPEAFLSSEDTLRIGKAASILASLPALQSTSSTSSISNTKIGDTSIEIHLNIAELSNDYDVDQMIDRVKKDIVDVSNSIGSSVILKK